MKRVKTKHGFRLEWEQEDLLFLNKNFSVLDAYEIGIKLGISHLSVRKKARELGLVKCPSKSSHVWTDEELKVLISRFPTDTAIDIADELGVSPPLVSKKARELGLKKAEGWSKNNYHARYIGNYRSVRT